MSEDRRKFLCPTCFVKSVNEHKCEACGRPMKKVDTKKPDTKKPAEQTFIRFTSVIPVQ